MLRARMVRVAAESWGESDLEVGGGRRESMGEVGERRRRRGSMEEEEEGV